MAVILQPSFGGGEYDPGLWGRQDLGRYGISGRLVKNWIVRPTGGLERRPGTRFIGEVKDSTRPVRFMRFSISETLAYLCVFNAGVVQFVYRGAFVTSGGVRVEVPHTYLDAELPDIRFTQSADTMFLVHSAHSPRFLKRTSATSFALSDLTTREGPFRTINSDQALKFAASAKTGTVTIESNFDIFTPALVGSLVYLEPEALGIVKPWVQGERTPSLTTGSYRKSDGKVYKATTVSIPSGTGAYCETGNVRPTHEAGREWDGPGDQRTFDTINYRVGVEWEYSHSGYGIVEITAYTDAQHVTGVVRKTLPDQVVGGFGTPANSWTFSGDSSTKVFSITGAVSTSNWNYAVRINGSPVQSDPNYVPPGGGTGSNNPYADELLP